MLGVYYREGYKTAGVPTRFLVGVEVPEMGGGRGLGDGDDSDEEEVRMSQLTQRTRAGGKRYYTFARVGGGMSLKELGKLHERLKPYYEEPHPDKLPSFINHRDIKKDLKPVFWVRPENSVVIEVYTCRGRGLLLSYDLFSRPLLLTARRI